MQAEARCIGDLDALDADELDALLYRAVAVGPDLASTLRAILGIARHIAPVEGIGVFEVLSGQNGEGSTLALAASSGVEASTHPPGSSLAELRAMAARAHASFVGVSTGHDSGPFDGLLPRDLPRPVVCVALGASHLEALLAMVPRGIARRAHVELAERLRGPIDAALAIDRRVRAASGLEPHAADASLEPRCDPSAATEGSDDTRAGRERVVGRISAARAVPDGLARRSERAVFVTPEVGSPVRLARVRSDGAASRGGHRWTR